MSDSLLSHNIWKIVPIKEFIAKDYSSSQPRTTCKWWEGSPDDYQITLANQTYHFDPNKLITRYLINCTKLTPTNLTSRIHLSRIGRRIESCKVDSKNCVLFNLILINFLLKIVILTNLLQTWSIFKVQTAEYERMIFSRICNY